MSAGRIELRGVPLDVLTREEAGRRMERLLETDGCSVVVTPNCEILYAAEKNAELRTALLGAGTNTPDSAAAPGQAGVKACMGVGGSLDVWAGEVKRAPEKFTRAGLEWLYRLVQQPSRIKRIVKIPAYLFLVKFTKKS